MPHAAFKETYFKGMMKAAKNGQSLSYAFGLGEDGQPSCFVLDDTLKPEALFAKVKSEKGLKKGSFGTCRMEGSALALSPDKKLAGLKKQVVEMAKTEGWTIKQYKVVGEEEEEIQTSKTPSPAAPPPPPGVRLPPGENENRGGTQSPEQENENPSPTPEQDNQNEAETPEEQNENTGGASPEDRESSKELSRHAATIEKAVQVWNKTIETVTKDLRKLQKAVLDLRDENSAPVIRALEGILRKLDRIDEEAEDAANAARAGDAQAYEREAEDFRDKVREILDMVESDEMIRDADANPILQVNIGKTLAAALNAILKSIN